MDSNKNNKLSRVTIKKLEEESDKLLTSIALKIVLENLAEGKKNRFLSLLDEKKSKEAWHFAQRNIDNLDNKILGEFKKKLKKILK